MEPAGRRSSGFLQVKEFSTGKGIKPHRQVSFPTGKGKTTGEFAALTGSVRPGFLEKRLDRNRILQDEGITTLTSNITVQTGKS
jgi:hypothetical protein